MRYEIMGPFRVIDEGRNATISAQKVTALLVTLLIRADRLVTTDQLTTEIWGDKAPRSSMAGIHVYVSQTRKLLNRIGRHSVSPIVTQSSGYLLRVGPDELDLRSFQDLMDQGRRQARQDRLASAISSFEDALALWRGPIPGDLCVGPIIGGFGRWLMEARLECIEMMFEAQLQLGRHREAIGPLYSLMTEYPLSEAFYRQLMLALHRAGRQADALKIYQVARNTLSDELGLEPCQEIRDIQRAILLGRTIDVRRPRPVGAPGGPATESVA